MAKETDLITDAELGELAAKISSTALEQIAIRWLDIDMDTVDNERKSCRENQWKLNFNLLRNWNNKNKDHEARQKLYNILTDAGKEGLLDPHKIMFLENKKTPLIAEPSAGLSTEQKTGHRLWEVIKGIKENTKRTLKTAMAPWAEECSVPLDEVQCKLHLQCLNGRPRNVLLGDYKGLFEGMGNWGEEGESEEKERQRISDALSNQNLQGPKKRVLIMGDYGTGKSTLSKKIAYDWATNRFKKFAIVFCIDMSFYVPGDDLGILVTEQIRSENTEVTGEMASNILEKLGHESLLILDGYDRTDLNVMVEMVPIHCNVLVTDCNPSQTDKDLFSKHCTAVVSPKNIFPLRQFPDSVLKCSVRSPFPHINTSPMVTMFLSILIKHDIIVPHKKRKFSLCEIFSHLTRYVLKRQEKEYFARFTLMVGNLAFDSFLKGKLYVELQDNAEQIQSPFLILARDSFYTFPHITLRYFLGALYFVLRLASGESVNALIARNCSRQIDLVMTNIMFLYFCFELLAKQQFSSFLTRKRRYAAYNKLGKYCVKRINLAQLDFVDFSAAYTGLYDLVFTSKYSKAQTFLNQILSKCHKTEMLYFRPNDPLDLFLKNVYPNLSWIYLTNGDTSLDADILDLSQSTPDDLKIVLINQEEMRVLKFVECANRINKKYSFYFFGKDKSEKTLDICQFLSSKVQKLFLSQDAYYCNVLVGSEIPKCSSLTHLTIKAEYFRFPGETVKAISGAIAEGKLPKASHVYLDAGPNQDLHSVVLRSSLPSLTRLDIKQELQGNDLLTLIENVLPSVESISIRSSEIRHQVLLTNQLTNLFSLTLHGGGNNDIFLQALDIGKMPSLRTLVLFDNNTDLTHILTPEKLLYLTSLGILRYKGRSIENMLTHDIIPQLNKLDLSHCNLGSKLSYLLRRPLPNLTSLTLCQCGLQTPDIQCLAQAYVEGKLAKLEHLNISHNNDGVHGNILENFFYKNCKWEKITSLNIQSVQSSQYQEVENLTYRAHLGFLPALQELKFSMREKFIVAGSQPPYWRDLHTMEIDCMNIVATFDVLGYIAHVLDTGLFPCLKVVRLCNWHPSSPANKISLRSKGVLVHFITR